MEIKRRDRIPHGIARTIEADSCNEAILVPKEDGRPGKQYREITARANVKRPNYQK
jgi:hypothetical protein